MRRGPLVCDLPDPWRPGEPEPALDPQRPTRGRPSTLADTGAVEADDCPEDIAGTRAWTARQGKGRAA